MSRGKHRGEKTTSRSFFFRRFIFIKRFRRRSAPRALSRPESPIGVLRPRVSTSGQHGKQDCAACRGVMNRQLPYDPSLTRSFFHPPFRALPTQPLYRNLGDANHARLRHTPCNIFVYS